MATPPFQPTSIRPGSSLYYALLFSTQAQREAITLLTHFFKTLHSIIETTSEASVAKAKFLWWSTEISNLFKGQPQHPLSSALINIIEKYQLPEIEFQNIIQSLLSEIDPSLTSDFLIFCRHLGGAKMILFCHILGGTKCSERFASHMGIALQLIELVRYFGRDSRKGRTYFAQAALPEHAELAKAYYQQALQTLTPSDRYPHLGLLVLGNLYFTLLKEIEREHFQVISHTYRLTPLRKLLIAWRSCLIEKWRNKIHK